jgi:hypothetical protein
MTTGREIELDNVCATAAVSVLLTSASFTIMSGLEPATAPGALPQTATVKVSVTEAW